MFCVSQSVDWSQQLRSTFLAKMGNNKKVKKPEEERTGVSITNIYTLLYNIYTLKIIIGVGKLLTLESTTMLISNAVTSILLNDMLEAVANVLIG